MPFKNGEKHHNYKHGHAAGRKSGAYKSWLAMMSRCSEHSKDTRPNYAGQGISVCKRWAESFENFLLDMGERPEGSSIERIDSTGNYEQGNCKWATSKDQARNKKTTLFVDICGEKLCLKDASEKYGVSASTIYRRYHNGLRGSDLIYEKNRNRFVTCEKKASSKISRDDAVSIIESVRCGASQASMAKQYGLSQSSISAIVNGNTWREVYESFHSNKGI